jgi:hypothetical protein
VPYKSLNPLLTTLTTCKGCGCMVPHLEQRLHDAACPATCQCRQPAEPPPLERVP